MTNAHRYDAIVVGGGHNGLVNGAYLAKAGMNTLILEQPDNRRYQADLNFDYSAVTGFGSIGNDEPLVRAYLMEYFKAESGYEAYAPFILDTYLKPVFAETKIVNGIGDQEKWFSMLIFEHTHDARIR